MCSSSKVHLSSRSPQTPILHVLFLSPDELRRMDPKYGSSVVGVAAERVFFTSCVTVTAPFPTLLLSWNRISVWLNVASLGSKSRTWGRSLMQSSSTFPVLTSQHQPLRSPLDCSFLGSCPSILPPQILWPQKFLQQTAEDKTRIKLIFFFAWPLN